MRVTPPAAGSERPGTPIGSSRAVVTANGFALRPLATHTRARERSIGRPSCAITRNGKRTEPGTKLAAPAVIATSGPRRFRIESSVSLEGEEEPQPATKPAARKTTAATPATSRVYG